MAASKQSRDPSASRRPAEAELLRIERPVTLVAQVEQTLRRAIEESEFPSGRLPTVVALADQLGVSRETVRLAMDSLQREGLIVKRRRRGTFINPPAVPSRLEKPKSLILAYLQADYDSDRVDGEVVTRPISNAMLDGALTEAGRHGYQLVVRRASPLKLRTAFDELQVMGPLQGAIFASVGEEKFLRRLMGLNLPAVLLDHDLHLPRLSSIRGDSCQNARLAVEHLIGLGHRRIACAHWHQDDLNPWFLRGYRESLRNAGLRRRRVWELSLELSRRGAEQAVAQLAAMSPRPTGLVCFHNTFAHQVITAAQQHGFRVPEELSVIGGGGEEIVGLTCCQVDWHELGREAVRMVLRSIAEGSGYKYEHILVPYTLRHGRSAARPSV